MKALGSNGKTHIVELNHHEYDALCRLAGYEFMPQDDIDIDLGVTLEKLSRSKLAYIVELLRNTADRLESVDNNPL